MIYNVTSNVYWKSGCEPYELESGRSYWGKTPNKGSRYSMSEGDSEAIQSILNRLAIGFPNDQFEVHTFEVIPQQFKKVE